MDDPIAVMLKFGFLAVLYLFLLWVARSSLRDLRRSVDPAVPEAAGRAGSVADGQGPSAGAAPRLEVVAAMGYEPGTAFEVHDGATLGRATAADIHVDDPYASASHARIFSRGGTMYVEDLRSTNGTYLNDKPLDGAEILKSADRIRIGDTEYRYRE